LGNGGVLADGGGQIGFQRDRRFRRDAQEARRADAPPVSARLLRGKHMGAAPDRAFHKAPPGGKIIGPADRADGNAEIIGKSALGRQLFAGRETAFLHRLFDGIGNRHIPGRERGFRPGACGKRGAQLC
jgi:hypothetical protein